MHTKKLKFGNRTTDTKAIYIQKNASITEGNQATVVFRFIRNFSWTFFLLISPPIWVSSVPAPTIFNKSFHTLPIHIMKINVISQLPEPPQSSCTNYIGNSKSFLTQPTSSYWFKTIPNFPSNNYWRNISPHPISYQKHKKTDVGQALSQFLAQRIDDYNCWIMYN